MLNLHAPYDSVGVRGNRDRRQRADERRGNADSLQLLRNRCAATMAAPSAGYLERDGDSGVAELRRGELADLTRGSDRGLVPDGAVDPRIDAADRALGFERAQGRERQRVIRALGVQNLRVEPAVRRLPVAHVEPLPPVDRVAARRERAGAGQMIRVPSRHDTRADDDPDDGLREIDHRSRRYDALVLLDE